VKIVTDFPRSVRVIENAWIPLPDGTNLAARIWLPHDAADAPVPALLEYLPYRKRDFMRSRDGPMHHYLAGHGYASVRVDIRGAGDSEGLTHDEYSETEHDDAIVVIEWLAAQPWCNGAVGMFGISWGGFNSLQVAAHAPAALKAIITVFAADDRYADDAHYMGGCLLNENLIWGTAFYMYNALPPDPEIVGDHPLLRWWGFKYISQRKGINIHADFAAVNVNFWITPDEANLDPEKGGLIIWDKPAPLEWTWTWVRPAGEVRCSRSTGRP